MLFSDLRNYRVGTASCNRRKITSSVGRHYYIIIIGIRILTEHPPTPAHPASNTARRHHDPHTTPSEREPHHRRRLKYRHHIGTIILCYILLYAVRSRGTAATTPVSSFLPQTTRRPYYWRGRHHYGSHVNLIIYARP